MVVGGRAGGPCPGRRRLGCPRAAGRRRRVGAGGGGVAFPLLPQSLLGVVPGYGEFTLAEALAFEDADLVALTITNVLGVRVDRVLSLGPGSLAAALPAQVATNLPVPLFVEAGDGVVEVLAAGPQSVDRYSVERLLVELGAGNSFDWLQGEGGG